MNQSADTELAMSGDRRHQIRDLNAALRRIGRGGRIVMTAGVASLKEELIAQVLVAVETFMVSLSGGNPAIQPLGPLIQQGQAQGYRFALETQGSVSRSWFADLDVLVLSPKPPSSAMATDWEALRACVDAAASRPRIVLKFVVFDEADFAYARDAAAQFPHLPVYLQPGNHTPPGPQDDDACIDTEGILRRMGWLVDRVIADRWFTAHVLPQLHVLLWGNKRGV